MKVEEEQKQIWICVVSYGSKDRLSIRVWGEIKCRVKEFGDREVDGHYQ